MGVNNLWPVLSELCERKPLTCLAGKKVAVDLSGWVVQAKLCKGLQKAKNPHLRNLFFRVSHLLQLGVHPIFVTEGKLPAIKEAAFKERNCDWNVKNGNSNAYSRSAFNIILQECQDLLSCLGVPCVKSSGEAEAFCAFLCLKGVVSGVITEDSDAFLYGADVIYRDFSIERADSHINVYCLKSEKNKLHLDQRKLVALSLILGCDYSKGVPGIGKETAVKLLSELSCGDILQRFKDWKNLSESELFPGLENEHMKKGIHCSRCEHLGSVSKHKKDGCSACSSEITCYLPTSGNPCRCSWHINDELKCKWKTELKIYNIVKKFPDFPDEKVIDEYLNFSDSIPCDLDLTWKCPNLQKFQVKAFDYLGWSLESSYEKCLPLITSWQQHKLKINSSNKSNFIFEPVKVLKEHNIKGVRQYAVQWKRIDCDLAFPSESVVTREYGDRFFDCYKGLVDEFYHAKSELKEKKRAKSKSKKLKTDEGNRKIPEYFVKNR